MRASRIALALVLGILAVVIVGNAVLGIDAAQGGNLWYRLGTTVGLDLRNPRPPVATTTALRDDGGYYETEVTGGRATLEQLATHLAEHDQRDRLFHAEGAWHVEGTLRIGPGAHVTITGQEVRLVTGGIEVAGGLLEISDSEIYSWDHRQGVRDTVVEDGRAWVRADNGRLEVRDSLLSELGFDRAGHEGVVIAAPAEGVLSETTLSHNFDGVTLDGVESFRLSRLHIEHALRHAITAADADGLVVADTTVSGGGDGVVVVGGRGAVVRDVVVRDVGGSGVVFSADATRAMLTESEITRSGGWGVEMADVDEVAVTDNLIYLNGAGVEITDGAQGVVVDGNRIAGNADSGVFVHGGSRDVTVRDNRIDLNAGSGVAMTEASGTIGPDNFVEGNREGIELGDLVGGGAIRNNHIADNIEDGVSLPLSDTVAIVDNRIVDNRRAAFSVPAEGRSSGLVEQNSVADNGSTERVREAG